MSLGLRLDIRQTQTLVLTPQLQQAIRLLQLSNIELGSVVEKELSENPFLERAEPAATGLPAPTDREPQLSGAPVLAHGGDGLPGRDAVDGWSPPGTTIAADHRLRMTRAGGSFDEQEMSLEGRLARPATLAEHLRAQLAGAKFPVEITQTAIRLVDWLEEDGYLRDPDSDLAAAMGVSSVVISGARAALLTCDPVGVGARDLAECLAAQLRERDRLDPAMGRLIASLPLLARADFGALQRICEVDLEDLRDMVGEIKALDPRPGLSFAPSEPIEAVPDVIVQRTSKGLWRVELNQATLPRVLVDKSYYAEISRQTGDRRDREFLSERYQAASWLAKALDQRARTVIRVAKAIFSRQLPFLEQGAEQLRPLVLRTIAEATGLHESTVSRATADKYAATPRGTFPLRYFFSTAIASSDDGELHSAEAIRQQIRRMVDNEEAQNVLSDDQIVAALKTAGVLIARRTVAKYRESLGIPSSVQRRRSRALSA